MNVNDRRLNVKYGLLRFAPKLSFEKVLRQPPAKCIHLDSQHHSILTLYYLNTFLNL